MEVKKFSLFFPEGRDLPRGWSIVGEKLHHLGVVFLERQGACSLKVEKLMVWWMKLFGFRSRLRRFIVERNN